MNRKKNRGMVHTYWAVGERAAGDKALPVRFVLLADGELVFRCVGLTRDGEGCTEEWFPQRADTGSQVLADMVRHLVVGREHRREDGSSTLAKAAGKPQRRDPAEHSGDGHADTPGGSATDPHGV